MRHRVERAMCPVCRANPILAKICTACHGEAEVILLHKPGYELEIHPLHDEAILREQYPDEPTPVHERTTVVQAWNRFMDMVEIRHAPPAQRREMKRAFYSGAWWMLEVLPAQLDPDNVATPDDIEYLQRVSDEIQRFNDDIQAGRA